jgi:hypothetical protein
MKAPFSQTEMVESQEDFAAEIGSVSGVVTNFFKYNDISKVTTC